MRFPTLFWLPWPIHRCISTNNAKGGHGSNTCNHSMEKKRKKKNAAHTNMPFLLEIPHIAKQNTRLNINTLSLSKQLVALLSNQHFKLNKEAVTFYLWQQGKHAWCLYVTELFYTLQKWHLSGTKAKNCNKQPMLNQQDSPDTTLSILNKFPIKPHLYHPQTVSYPFSGCSHLEPGWRLGAQCWWGWRSCVALLVSLSEPSKELAWPIREQMLDQLFTHPHAHLQIIPSSLPKNPPKKHNLNFHEKNKTLDLSTWRYNTMHLSTYPVVLGLGQQSVVLVVDLVQCCRRHVPEAVKKKVNSEHFSF